MSSSPIFRKLLNLITSDMWLYGCLDRRESEVSGLRSRLILLQENNEKLEERLCKATLELAGACKRADAAVKKRIELENEVSSNEEAIDNLDKQLEESKFNLSASESKYDDISRKLSTLE